MKTQREDREPPVKASTNLHSSRKKRKVVSRKVHANGRAYADTIAEGWLSSQREGAKTCRRFGRESYL